MSMGIMSVEVEAMVNTHSHLREGNDIVRALVDYNMIGGADVILPMPNTKDGLKTIWEVLEYLQVLKEIREDASALGNIISYIPTMLLNEATSEHTLEEATPAIKDVKLYPYLRTTNSEYGIRNYGQMMKLIKLCGKRGVKVHVHPEHPWMTYSSRDAEFAFLSIVKMFLEESEATIVWEHGTDARCIPFWKDMASTGRFFVTLTAHHLLTNEDAVFGDVRAVCKPPIKTDLDREHLVDLVRQNHSWVMAGPDDAPHPLEAKHVHEGKCACGAFYSPYLLQLYAQALSDILMKDKDVFINFTSRNARKLHNLPEASQMYQLIRKPYKIPSTFKVGSWTVEPFWAGRTIDWSLER
jgi:dihydroorotase